MNRNALLGGAAALGTAVLAVHRRTARAEREHPAPGRFVEVDGVRLHYLERGSGPPLVLFHGLGSMVEELALSGLIDAAAERYRVIAFDRPGYGHSERPRRLRYTAAAQAALFNKAVHRLDAHRPIVLGHSWGALVAAEMALQFPEVPRSLVLASGLFFPGVRLDAPLLAPPAIPLVGDLMAHTVSPLLGRAAWPHWLRMIFAPRPVPEYMARFPTWLALRPAQLRATAEDSLFTTAATLRIARHARKLTLPVMLVAGEKDRYVSTRAHSARLRRLLPFGRLFLSPEAGHMVHHADLDRVLTAVDAAAWSNTLLA